MADPRLRGSQGQHPPVLLNLSNRRHMPSYGGVLFCWCYWSHTRIPPEPKKNSGGPPTFPGQFPDLMANFSTPMVNFPTPSSISRLHGRFPDPMVDFPTPMVDFPTPMVDSPKNAIVTKTFAPKFRSEPSDREVHSSHGDYFRDNFCDCDSEPLSGNFQSTFGQLPDTS